MTITFITGNNYRANHGKLLIEFQRNDYHDATGLVRSVFIDAVHIRDGGPRDPIAANVTTELDELGLLDVLAEHILEALDDQRQQESLTS